ncbi:MAG: SIMPL domain-containing protein [Gemmatimonadaceae bacterium]
MLKRIALLSIFSAAVIPFHANSAQTTDQLREATPSIGGTASSDVKLTPDRATIRISVQTRASTASTAAAQNAIKQNAVLTALRSLGLANEQLSTTDYSVNPEYRYEQNKSPVLTGYTVTNTILADVRDLKLLGKVLDASLGSGANMVSSLDFYSSNTDAARRGAIGVAVTKARSEAEVAAKAAGGTLGELISLEIGGANQNPPPRPMMRMASATASDATPINPGEQTVTVTVSARWRYVAGQ